MKRIEFHPLLDKRIGDEFHPLLDERGNSDLASTTS